MMKICPVCEQEHDDKEERCPICGGELRKRTISDAALQLFNEPEDETERQ